MRTTVVETDIENSFGWATRTTTTDDATGEIVARETVADNGTVIEQVFYPDGYVDPIDETLPLVGEIRTISDDGDTGGWAARVEHYRLGTDVLLSSYELADDGSEKTKHYDVQGRLIKVTTTDTPDLKSSASTVTHYVPETGESERTIILDNGDVRTETVAPSDLVQGATTLIRSFEDNSNSQSWRTKVDTFEVFPTELTGLEKDDRIKTASVITYDDGVVYEDRSLDLYETPMKKWTDVENVKPWETIVETYPSGVGAGDAYERITTFDDGSTQRVLADTSRVFTVLIDANGETISTNSEHFDADGNLTTRSYGNAGETSFQDTYTNGVLTQRIEQDGPDHSENDVADFVYKISTYNTNGDLVTHSVAYDDDTVQFEEYDNGQLIYREALHENGETSLRDIRTYDDAGTLMGREIFTHNHITESESFYARGQLVSRVQTDLTGEARIGQRSETYDNGELERRETIYNGGSTRVETFSDGVRLEDERVDVSDEKSWTAVINKFDVDGNLAEKKVYFDSGIQQTDSYDGGVLHTSAVEDTADIRPENWIVSEYAENGDLTERTTYFDDGVECLELFEGGVRTSVGKFDLGDVASYDTIVTHYDVESGTSEQFIYFDNGLERYQHNQDGQKMYFREVDNSADGTLRNYQEKEKLYDEAGVIVVARTLADDGDEFKFYYENGELTHRREIDGDGSDPWAAELRSYENGVQVGVVQYDNELELPPEFSDAISAI